MKRLGRREPFGASAANNLRYARGAMMMGGDACNPRLVLGVIVMATLLFAGEYLQPLQGLSRALGSRSSSSPAAPAEPQRKLRVGGSSAARRGRRRDDVDDERLLDSEDEEEPQQPKRRARSAKRIQKRLPKKQRLSKPPPAVVEPEPEPEVEEPEEDAPVEEEVSEGGEDEQSANEEGQQQLVPSDEITRAAVPEPEPAPSAPEAEPSPYAAPCAVRPSAAELVARFHGDRNRLLANDDISYDFLNRVAAWQREAGYAPRDNVGQIRDGNHPNPAGGDTTKLVLDIGANTGQYVDAFRTAYGSGVHIHTFEPLEKTYKKLIELKTPDRKVHVRQVALTNFTGSVTFYSPPISNTVNDLFEFPTGASIGATEDSSQPIGTVPADTVDAFLARLASGKLSPDDEGGLPPGSGPAHVLCAKIDTEGADLSVLRGAANTLAAGRIEALQFEVNYKYEKMQGKGTLVDGVRLLERAGYDVYLISRGGPWHPISGQFWDPAYENTAEIWDSSNVAAVRARPPVPWFRQFQQWALKGDAQC